MISRFRFNISLKESFKNIFKIIFFKKNQRYDLNLKKELTEIYKEKNLFFFDHGRTAFYEILSRIKEKTDKKKILINSFTLFEIVNVIIYSGFTPVFIDTKKNSFQTEVDIKKTNVNTNDIAAIVITHLNGANFNIVNLKKQIEDHNAINEKIYLIEDCAVALGAKINNRDVGTFGDYSFSSFNIMKNITSYTGGVLIDNNNEIEDMGVGKYKYPSKIDIISKILFVITIQILNTKIIFPLFFLIIKYSYKFSINFFLKKYRTDFKVSMQKKFPEKFSYTMHEFQKKILLPQFQDYKMQQILRTSKSQFYFDRLKDLEGLNFPQTDFGINNIFLDFPIICEKKNDKKGLFEYLMKKKLDIKGYYYRNCAEEKIYHYDDSKCENSSNIAENILMLPVHQGIEERHQNEIIKEIKNFFEVKK